MSQGEIAGTLQTLRAGWSDFFHRRCLAGFPWFWPARTPGVPAMVAARRMARRQFGRDRHPVYRALAQVLAALAWPPAVLIQLWQLRYFCGPETVPIKHVPGALWAAMRHNVQPGEYFAYALWQPDRKVNVDNYLYAKEGPRLFRVLNQPSQPNPIGDKLAFREMCESHALPSPEILAAFTPAGKLLDFESGQPPERDLFVKPRIGVAAHGTEYFRWQGVVFESDRGRRLTPEDLGGYLATRAQTENRTLLVQPALSNHPELRLGANVHLATTRLVTGLSADGSVIPIFGHIDVFHFGVTNQILARRVALIDVASGRLLWSPREFADGRRWNRRPDNGSDDIPVLPYWDTILRHTKVAHHACPNYTFVGWDAAVTEQGPMLLEGNANWCADDYQRLRGEALGLTKFADVLATRLRDLEGN